MLFRVGSYTHPANEVNLSSMTNQAVPNRRGGPDYIRRTLSVQGTLIPDAAAQDAIRDAIVELESAYANSTIFNGPLAGDAGLLHDDGTPSPHYLPGAAAQGGVRIRALNYPRGDAAEYATGRTFSAVFQADYVDALASEVMFFQDTLTTVGDGGPRNVLIEVDNGLPEEQTVSEHTPCFATQSGVAVGRTSYPLPATPLFAAARRVGQRRQIAVVTPNFRNSFPTEFAIRWSYSFQAPTAVFNNTVPATEPPPSV